MGRVVVVGKWAATVLAERCLLALHALQALPCAAADPVFSTTAGIDGPTNRYFDPQFIMVHQVRL